MIKAIIFDLDGVLVSTDRFHFLAWSKLCEEAGLKFDEDINKHCLGVSRLDSLNIILNSNGSVLSDDEKQKFCQRKNEYYLNYISKMSSEDVADDTRKTLLKLKQKGVKLAVGSSSKNAKTILRKVNLFDFFDEVVDGTDVLLSKPNPEVFLKAAKLLGVAPQNCAIVDDALAGIRAGRQAQMVTFAFGEIAKDKIADFNIFNLVDIVESILD